MFRSRRPRSRLLARLLVPATVVGLTVASTAVPAQAVLIPPPVQATIVSANPSDVTPHVQNGSVRAFAQIGNTVYAGGSFTGVKAAGATSWTPVTHLFAYDANTGALRTGFTPAFDNAVQTLAVSPDGKLIVGGNFGTVNGVSRKNLVAIDPETGDTVASWVGRADGGVVRRAIVHGNYLYIAGAFHWVNGTQHSLLARLNATTGAIDSGFQIDASGARPYDNSFELVWSIAVAPDGNTMVAVGNFTDVNGEARNQVAVIDLSGVPAVTSWNTDRYVPACHSGSFPFYARDVDFSDDGEFFVIIADGGRGTNAYCDTIARFETAHRGDVTATWVNVTGTDSVTSVEIADNVVYVAGHFRWLNNANGSDRRGNGGIDRYGFGALDSSNGMPLNWNPGRSPGNNLPTGGTNWGPIVWELWKGSNGIYAGFDSDGAGNEYHGRQALFPSAGGRTIPVQDAPTATSGYLYLGGVDGELTKVPFNPAGTGLGAATVTAQPNLTSARSAFVVNNKLFWAQTDADAPAGGNFNISMFTNGTAGAPWIGNNFNNWFNWGVLNSAFALNGRMYFTTSTGNALQYRYITADGYLIGCTPFSLPTKGIDWRTVRGMTWVDGHIVYGSTDGTLRSVPFDPAAETAVDADNATVLATGTEDLAWNSPTLFFASS